MGLAGSKITMNKPSAKNLWSEWSDKSNPGLISKQPGKNWVLNYLSWTFRSGNLWAIFLCPFMLILKATEESSDIPLPESLMTYTLF